MTGRDLRVRDGAADVGAFEAGGRGGSDEAAQRAAVGRRAKVQCSMRNSGVRNARDAHAGYKSGEVLFFVEISLAKV